MIQCTHVRYEPSSPSIGNSKECYLLQSKVEVNEVKQSRGFRQCKGNTMFPEVSYPPRHNKPAQDSPLFHFIKLRKHVSDNMRKERVG